MKINLEFGIDGTVRAYVKMPGPEAELLGGNPIVATSLLQAISSWITDLTSEVVINEDTMPDSVLATRVFEPDIDFYHSNEAEEAANQSPESSEHKHTPIPNYLQHVDDIFKGTGTAEE